MSQSALFLILFLLVTCKGITDDVSHYSNPFTERPAMFDAINAIPPPPGYQRILLEQESFGEWLRAINLKKDNYVYLYDGTLKKNQSVHFAVLDVPVGKKDLQQCADAIIRLRAEYLFAKKRYSEISFSDNNNKSYRWVGGNNKIGFINYLENVFCRCGTASLQKQLKAVADLQQMQPGDIFIKGGFPGHAMIVVDVAQNKKGEKLFMLAQSYMPAQDIHIVINPAKNNSPWYEISGVEKIITPGWIFEKQSLREW